MVYPGVHSPTYVGMLERSYFLSRYLAMGQCNSEVDWCCLGGKLIPVVVAFPGTGPIYGLYCNYPEKTIVSGR